MHRCSYIYEILAPALLNKIIRFTWSDCNRHCCVLCKWPGGQINNSPSVMIMLIPQKWVPPHTACTHTHAHPRAHLSTPWIFKGALGNIQGDFARQHVKIFTVYSQQTPHHSLPMRTRYAIPFVIFVFCVIPWSPLCCKHKAIWNDALKAHGSICTWFEIIFTRAWKKNSIGYTSYILKKNQLVFLRSQYVERHVLDQLVIIPISCILFQSSRGQGNLLGWKGCRLQPVIFRVYTSFPAIPFENLMLYS